jgi:hypothetical protein
LSEPSAIAPLEVYDLALGADLLAAVGVSRGAQAPVPRAFPADGPGIERLAGGLDY